MRICRGGIGIFTTDGTGWVQDGEAEEEGNFYRGYTQMNTDEECAGIRLRHLKCVM